MFKGNRSVAEVGTAGGLVGEEQEAELGPAVMPYSCLVSRAAQADDLQWWPELTIWAAALQSEILLLAQLLPN